jgi:ferrochelatase
MGGPGDLSQVRPYLREIFRDPAILPVPGLLRSILSTFIVSIRASKAVERYREIGGKSPINHWTPLQTKELSRSLAEAGHDADVRYAFRYSEPTIQEVLADFADDGYKQLTVVPLFPHYSFAMNGSINLEVEKTARSLGLRYRIIDSFGNHALILDVWRTGLLETIKRAGRDVRVLFVAHGIPQRDIDRGDPYTKQVEKSVRALAESLPEGINWSYAYQSKVGPLDWSKPYLEDEIERLIATSEPIVIMALSFVCDCLETLYDLDIIAQRRIEQAGVSKTLRVPVFNDDPRFSDALAQMLIGND